MTAALVAAALASLVVAGWTAQARRGRDDVALRDFEQQAAAAETNARSLAERRAQSARLDALGMRRKTLQTFLDDLAWASRAKDPKAQITGLQWSPEHMRIRATGQASPFASADRDVQKEGAGAWSVDPPAVRR